MDPAERSWCQWPRASWPRLFLNLVPESSSPACIGPCRLAVSSRYTLTGCAPGSMIVCGHGEQHGQYRAASGRAVHGHTAAHGLYPVTQACQARAAARVGTADAVIPDLDPQRAPGLLDEDVHRRGARVLGGVGEGLGGDVVGGDLAGTRESA